MSKNHIRASNFSEAEENILVKCILRHVETVEDKKTDACTLNEKQRVWEKISNEFNSLCPNVVRQIAALKDKYTNIKTILRKEFIAEKASHEGIGSAKEKPEWRKRSEAMTELAKLISVSKHNTSPRVVSVDNISPLILSVSLTSKSSSKDRPSMLSKPNSSQLKRPTSAALSDKEDALQSLKKKLIKGQLRMRKIEARMVFLESQKMDCENKVMLRELKIAKQRSKFC